jgi:hypothetical protein
MSDNYRFFKFRDINKNSIASLINGTIYFSPLDKLNDPFDCNLDIKKAILNAAKFLKTENSIKLFELLKNDTLIESLHKKYRRIGICSFSLKLKDVLLWPHYANNHKGMCILYEFPMQFLDVG